jgi:hypothetical protein
MLIQFPACRIGNGHDQPDMFVHPTGAPDQQSHRHGRSFTEHNPNRLFVRSHSTSVAIWTE